MNTEQKRNAAKAKIREYLALPACDYLATMALTLLLVQLEWLWVKVKIHSKRRVYINICENYATQISAIHDGICNGGWVSSLQRPYATKPPHVTQLHTNYLMRNTGLLNTPYCKIYHNS